MGFRSPLTAQQIAAVLAIPSAADNAAAAAAAILPGIPTASQNAAATVAQLPATTSVFGDGSDGAVTLFANLSMIRDYQCTTFDNNGYALVTQGYRMRCTTSFLMRDTGAGDPSVYNDGSRSTTGSMTGGGAGGSGGTATTGSAGSGVSPGLGGSGGSGGGGSSGFTAGGAAGRSTGPPIVSAPLALLGTLNVGGGGGGGQGGGNTGAPSAGVGGAGGGVVSICAPTITLQGASCRIDVDGAPGSNSPSGGYGAGGGGGGGAIVLVTRAAVAGAGYVTYAGGAGGVATAPGLNGAAGTRGNLLIGQVP